MANYTYLENEDCYITDDGVHISKEAKAAIDAFVKESTSSKSGSKWKSTLKDKEIKVLSADVVDYDNAFSVKTSTLYDGSVFETLKYHSLIVGNDQDNVIHGNDGNSTWSGRDDTIFAGRGDDIVFGYGGDDILYGEQGDDVLYGGGGDDTLYGGTGNDVLYGGGGDDAIYGGEGNDWLFSGAVNAGASDKLFGGDGADSFVIGEVAGGETNVIGMDWGALALSLAGDVTDLGITAYQPSYKMKLVKEVVPMVFDVIKGVGAMSKEKIAAPKAAYVTIEDFNPLEDVVIIPLNKDGNANIFLSTDTNTANALTIKSDTGNATDIIATLTFDQASKIFGDEFTTMNAKAQQAFVDALMQSALIVDADGVSLGMQNGTKLDIDASLLQDFGANQYLIFGAYSGYSLEGGSSADILFGNNHGDILSGYNLDPASGTAFAPELAGDDELYGFGGDDVFYGGGGNNHLFGGSGSDTASYIHANRGITVDMTQSATDANGTYVQLANGHARIEYVGGQPTEIIGTDKLYSIENIIGTDYDDTIIGDDNDNALATGFGDDVLTGNGGADRFIITGGSNTITDFSRGDGDKIEIDASIYGIATRSDITVKTDGDQVRLLVDDDRILTLTVEDSFDINTDVSLFSSDEDWDLDPVDQMIGPVTILGTDGNDTLVALDVGAMHLTGSTLIAGAGDDIMIGGDGKDTFVVNGGSNTIMNYEWGSGRVELCEQIYLDSKKYGVKDLVDDIEVVQGTYTKEDGSTGNLYSLYSDTHGDDPFLQIQSKSFFSVGAIELYNM